MPHGFAGPDPDRPSWPRRKARPGKADAPGNGVCKSPTPSGGDAQALPHAARLFIPEGIDRIKRGGLFRGIEAEENPDGGTEGE